MRHPVIVRGSLSSLVVALALSACGGGASEEPSAARADAADSVPTLLDDEGQPMPSSVRPADAGAWTTNARYATPRQAQLLAGSLGDSLLQVSTECCGEDAVDRAAGIVWAVQAAADVPDSQLRVLVRGSDERLAAATVNRLLQGGLREVWLVTAQQP
jgi:hypothetical protein